MLLKLIAFRSRDQEDIKGILTVNAGRLDVDWVRRELLQLVDAGDAKLNQFDKLVGEFKSTSDS